MGATVSAIVQLPIRYRNLLWMHVVASTSTGYGQYLTHTYPGRICLGCSILIGCGFVGLIVSAVGSAMMLSGQEEKLLLGKQSTQSQEKMMTAAVIALQT